MVYVTPHQLFVEFVIKPYVTYKAIEVKKPLIYFFFGVINKTASHKQNAKDIFTSSLCDLSLADGVPGLPLA